MDKGDGLEPLTVYLDIDGVVTTAGYQRRAGKDRLDPARMAIVAALVRDLGARVVVSSTWRVDDCRSTLVEGGLPQGCFHPDWRTAISASSRNPDTGAMLAADQAKRGDEVAEHATRNGVTRYLVLDDVELGIAHKERHVRPDPSIGVTDADTVLAKKLVALMDARREAARHGFGVCTIP